MFVAVDLFQLNGFALRHCVEEVEVAGILGTVLFVKMDSCECGKDVGALSRCGSWLVFSVLAESLCHIHKSPS